MGSQLRGEVPLPLEDVGWQVQHARLESPFRSCRYSGLLAQTSVRTPFRDFILNWASENAAYYMGQPGGLQRGGFRYVSLGVGNLLFDLEVIERIRAMHVHVSQICIIDPAIQRHADDTRRGLQELADWQRAVAQMDREEPAEILVFTSIDDFVRAAAARV